MRCIRWTAVFGTGLLALACKKDQAFTPPPPEVAVVTVAPHTVEQVYEFAGTVQASKSVQVRAQVSGVITARAFTEGQTVSVGDLLYQIDRTALEADWRAATARLSEAEARAANAKQTLARFTALLADNAISKQDFDNASAQSKQADASVEEARGNVDRAKKSLDDTRVRAELSGRVGRALLEVGARVRGSEDILTMIDVLDPIYVTFRPSSQQQLAWKRDARVNRQLVPGGPLRLEAVLPDGSTAPSTGRIDFIDPVIDPATGTQQFRGEFTNKERLLVPGQFVRVRLLGITRDSSILVPQRAVLLQMGRQTVYVVAAGDSVRGQEVTATSWTGDQWLIERGLKPGDRVIVDGVQKVFPGAKVKVVEAKRDSSAAAAAGKPQ